MKYLKTFEYVRNTKFKYWFVNNMINEIERLNTKSEVDRVRNNENDIFGSFAFQTNPNFEKQIKKILKKNKEKAKRSGLTMVYDYGEHGFVNGILKEAKLKRIKPSHYVYHVTDSENLDSILKDGLKINKSDSESWSIELFYPNAIFASMEGEEVFQHYDGDDNRVVLKIDTSKIENKWWVDLNFYDTSNNILFRDFIMTFNNIPSYAIEEYDG